MILIRISRKFFEIPTSVVTLASSSRRIERTSQTIAPVSARYKHSDSRFLGSLSEVILGTASMDQSKLSVLGQINSLALNAGK